MDKNLFHRLELTTPTAALMHAFIVGFRTDLDATFREKCDEVVRTGNWWSTPGLLARKAGAYASFYAVIGLMPFGETKALKWNTKRIARFATA